MPTDAELLRQYVKGGSEAAFTEIVQRHAGLVYSVALRLVDGNRHLAKDVTRDVFILLARKAPMLIGYEALAGWLHTTTRYVAFCMIRGLRRRETRELEAVAMQTNSAPEVQWEQLRPVLDEAVGQLDDRDRNAVLLRYFEGKSYSEVGAALGLTENSARARTERALEKLRRHFARSGVVTTGALLAEALTVNAAQAAPAGLVAEVAAVAHAKGLSLGHVLLKTLFMTTKTKIVASVIVFGLLIVGAWRWSQPGLSSGKPSDAAGVSSAPIVAQPANLPLNPNSAVAAPTADPVRPSTLPADAAAPPGATAQTADPRADLNSAILDILQLAAANDYTTLAQNYLNQKAPPPGMTPEQVMQNKINDPATQQMLQTFADMLGSMRDTVPELSADGNRALLRATPDADTGLVFTRSNGTWHIAGIEKETPGDVAPATPPGQKIAPVGGGGYVP